MKISKFFPPYYEKNGVDHCTLKTDYLKKAGVYFIKENGIIVYVGHSSTILYKTIYRHFQKWDDKRSERKVYNKYSCTIRIITTTPTQAPRLEGYLIQKMQPRDNEIKYDLINFDAVKLKDIAPIPKEDLIDEEAPF